MQLIKNSSLITIVLLIAACSSTSSVDTNAITLVKNADLTSQSLPYEIGSQTFFIHDDSRPYDSVAGVNVGVRSLLTEIWYPVDREHINSHKDKYFWATYGDYVLGDTDIHQLMMTQTTFFHLTPDSVVEGVSQATIDSAISELFDRQRASYVAAPLASEQKTYPVIVMTHGDAGSRYNMESVCEYLAGHGYVVIAPEHTGNTPFALSGRDPELKKDTPLATKLQEILPYLNENGTYGSIEKYGQTYTPLIRDRSNPQAMLNLDNSLLQRVNDLRATVKHLEELNNVGEFAGRLELSKIGLMGRSFGGTTTLAGLALEPRFTAGVAVVPMVMPDFRASLPQELLKPIGEESILLAADGPSPLNTISKPTMLLSGAEDALIIGVGAAMVDSLGGEKPSLTNPLPALRSSYEATQQPVFWGLLENSNHSSFGISAGYWWPELKPKTQARYFSPNTQFNLIDVADAHLIQKVKVKQFFDTMVLGKQQAGQALVENQFAELGLQFESRNF